MGSEWAQTRIKALGPISEDSQLEPVVITLEPGGPSRSRPYGRRAEQLAVGLQGTVELILEENTCRLKRGNAACIPSEIHHCWRNTSRTPAQVLIVTAQQHE